MKLTYTFVLVLLLGLAACGAASQGQEPIPTVVLEGGSADFSSSQTSAVASTSSDARASGVVVPAQEAKLAFATAGSVMNVSVTAGDEVTAGDVLVELENATVQLEVEQAQRTIRELTSPAAIAAGEQAVVAAQKNYTDAKNKVDSINSRRTDQATIDYYEAQLVLAQKALDQARDAYNSTSSLSSADPQRATATTNLYAAQQTFTRAQANLNWYTELPSETDIAQAKANLAAAEAALQEAQWYLAELKGQDIPAEATGAQLARLQQAHDALRAAEEKLSLMRLQAPFDGVVRAVNIVAGEYALPGQVVVVLSDVTNLQVVTTDLGERDVAKVSLDQRVTVLVEALGVEIDGQVILISPVADTLGGDVIYKTTIALDSLPDGIRAGMRVTVQYLR